MRFMIPGTGRVDVIRLTEDAAHVWGLFVEPEARGRGVGRELMREVVAWADREGYALTVEPRASDQTPPGLTEAERDAHFDSYAERGYPTTDDLEAWYLRLGFVPADGRELRRPGPRG